MATKKQWLAALKAVNHAISKRSTLPMLQYVYIDRETLHTTDLEQGIMYAIETGINEPVTVPHGRLQTIINLMDDDGSIEISAIENNTVLLHQGATEYKIMGMPVDEFPRQPEIGKLSGVVPLAAFRDALARAHSKISHESNRVNITGLLLDCDNDGMHMAATDGRRLYHELLESDILAQFYTSWHEFKAIVPHKTILSLCALLPKKAAEDEVVFLYVRDNGIAFEIGNALIISNLIDATFPNYQQVIPCDTRTWLRADVKELTKAIKKAQVLCTDRYNLVMFDVNGCIEVKNKSPEIGEVLTLVEHRGKWGDDVTVGVNPTYALDALGDVEGDIVEIGIRDAQSSLVFREPERPYLNIVMPMPHNLPNSGKGKRRLLAMKIKIEMPDWNTSHMWPAEVEVHAEHDGATIGTASIDIGDAILHTPVVIHSDGAIFTPSWDGDQIDTDDDAEPILEQVAQMCWFDAATGQAAIVVDGLPRLFPV